MAELTINTSITQGLLNLSSENLEVFKKHFTPFQGRVRVFEILPPRSLGKNIVYLSLLVLKF